MLEPIAIRRLTLTLKPGTALHGSPCLAWWTLPGSEPTTAPRCRRLGLWVAQENTILFQKRRIEVSLLCESLPLFCGFRRLPLSIARVAISTVSFYAALSIAPRALQTPLLTPGSHNVAFDIVFDRNLIQKIKKSKSKATAGNLVKCYVMAH